MRGKADKQKCPHTIDARAMLILLSDGSLLQCFIYFVDFSWEYLTFQLARDFTLYFNRC